VLVPSSVTAFGEAEHAAPVGAPVHATVTARLYPPSGVRLRAYTALPPGETAADDEPDARPIVKSAPVPERATFCGLPLALSKIEAAPVIGPPAVGPKLSWMVQIAPATTVDPQLLLVWLKLALTEIPVMLNGPFPELVNVTGCAALVVPTVWLENVRLPGESVTNGVPAIPVPARLAV